eukprot:8251641-Alexandrium_andersonii.AAC.1
MDNPHNNNKRASICAARLFRPPGALLVVAIGLSGHSGAERTPRDLRGPILTSLLGPRLLKRV